MKYVIIAVIIFEALSFLITAVSVKILSICFGFAFTWKLAIGIWIVISILKSIASAAKPSK
jgi:hypothetical protein